MRRRRAGPQLELGVLYLLLHIIDVGIERIPIVTLFFVIGQTLLYMGILNVPWTKMEVCISPTGIIDNKDYKSLILGTLEHGDDMHLYYNMISFLVKGRVLERRYGSVNFLILMLWLIITSSSFYVILSLIAVNVLRKPELRYTCAIGFSGVIFALKTILYKEEPLARWSFVYFTFPAKYAVWAELLMIHVLVPNASFIGHLAGIVAGLIYTSTFVGRFFDNLISSVTGDRFIHSYSFGLRRTR